MFPFNVPPVVEQPEEMSIAPSTSQELEQATSLRTDVRIKLLGELRGIEIGQEPSWLRRGEEGEHSGE